MATEWIAFVVGMFVGCFILIAAGSLYPEGTKLYKQGQTDALSGHVVYELKDQSDGTRTWERKK